MKQLLPLFAGLSLITTHAFAHSDAPSAQNSVEAEAEIYSGRRGYMHLGVGVTGRLSEHQVFGINGHVVREEAGADEVPSLGAFVRHTFENGFELTAHSFGYFPVERQHAWGAGLRGSKRVALSDHSSVAPFLGFTYSQVKAFDEAVEATDSVHHLLFLGGATLTWGRLDLTAFASQSVYDRGIRGVESHVDLQEVTQITAYENVDGFARNSAGIEASYAITDWLSFTVRYAAVRFETHTRHATMLTPSVRIGDNVEVFGGVQFLRGGEEENDLVVGGMSVAF
jgi:hypothetical protein